MATSTASAAIYQPTSSGPSVYEAGINLLSYPETLRARREFHNPRHHGMYRDCMAGILEKPEARELCMELRAFDEPTYEHSRRVMTHSLDTAFYFGLHNKYGIDGMIDLAQAGLFHDVGKMMMAGDKDIARIILNFPGPLSDEERALVRQHPILSYEIIAPFNLRAAQVALRHHERNRVDPYPWNGYSVIFDRHLKPNKEGTSYVLSEPRPLDARPMLEGVDEFTNIVAANDMRDGACSYVNDIPGRSYQQNSEAESSVLARELINNFAGPKGFIEFATRTMRDAPPPAIL